MSTSTNLLQSSKYKCFWDFLHVQTGAQIIALLVLFNCCMTFVDTFSIQEEKSAISFGLEFLDIFAEAISFAFIFVGIKRSIVDLFAPSLVLTAFRAGVYGFYSILCLAAANSKSSLGRLALLFLKETISDKVTDDNLVYGIVYLSIKTFIALFIFDILYRCSKYINEKSCPEKTTQTDHKYTQTQHKCIQTDQKSTQTDNTLNELTFQSSFPETKESSTA